MATTQVEVSFQAFSHFKSHVTRWYLNLLCRLKVNFLVHSKHFVTNNIGGLVVRLTCLEKWCLKSLELRLVNVVNGIVVLYSYAMQLCQVVIVAESDGLEEGVRDLQFFLSAENNRSHGHVFLLLCRSSAHHFGPRSRSTGMGSHLHSLHNYNIELGRDTKVEHNIILTTT